MKVEEIINSTLPPSDKIAALSQKEISLRPWTGHNGLEKEYDAEKHAVMNKGLYPDIVNDGKLTHVSRVTLSLQKLAVSRMTSLCCAIPVKRIYKPKNDRQAKVAEVVEAIYQNVCIDEVNDERLEKLFASCEVLTLWFAVISPNDLYGQPSQIKMRCRTFSPKDGDMLYPMFDEYGDLVALSIAYSKQTSQGKTIRYFETYTADKHIKWMNDGTEWSETMNEAITLGKIPAIYAYRPTPIWENTSAKVEEIEWNLSRNGNYIRENSKPLFAVFADENIAYGDEKSAEEEGKAIMQFPKGSTAGYITWPQAVENLKYQNDELRSWFFTELQLPDWSYDKMSQQALSGESRKQMFIDARLKVKRESGRLLKMFRREANVIKAFVKAILGDSYAKDIEALQIDHIITPFVIEDKTETVNYLTSANGGKPIMSQRESIEYFGYSDNVDKTMQQIIEEGTTDALYS